MEGEQIPKATMNNFIKNKLKISYSAQFTNRLLYLAKDYINRLTQQANDVCTQNNKKTINAQHIQSSLENFGLKCQLKQLKDINNQIKQQHQIKQQFRQRIQQNIQKNLQEISGQQHQPRLINIKNNISQISAHNPDQDDDDYDYQAEIEKDNEIINIDQQEQKNKKI